jgi:peptide subunit release factor 1 (eRF1)
MPITEQLTTQLDRVASTDTGPFPVISLYLNLQPNDRGRDDFEPFLRREMAERVGTYPARGPERDSLDRDAEKIREYVNTVDPSVNGLAVFACGGAELFEAVPLAAPIDEHRLYISDQPHLYPLARLLDQYPRYAALLADTHSARIFVFAANAVERTEQIEGTKTKHHKRGGWSQARYQRHTENFHVHHVKEVVDTLARIVREDAIGTVLVSGDDVVRPLLREHMPKEIADRVVETESLDIRTPLHEILASTLAALREQDAATDRERVDALIGAYRANGLACAGIEAVKRAFELGQVDELVIAASPQMLSDTPAPGGRAAQRAQAADGGAQPERTEQERAADELIVQARNTSAKIRFIEDSSLLAPIGGVGAFLRFKL